jgi:hypothetical protein
MRTFVLWKTDRGAYTGDTPGELHTTAGTLNIRALEDLPDGAFFLLSLQDDGDEVVLSVETRGAARLEVPAAEEDGEELARARKLLEDTLLEAKRFKTFDDDLRAQVAAFLGL